MCTVLLEKDRIDERFFITNTILRKTNKFSIHEIQKELADLDLFFEDTVEKCVKELVDFGLIYEDGSGFVVKQRESRWRAV